MSTNTHTGAAEGALALDRAPSLAAVALPRLRLALGARAGYAALGALVLAALAVVVFASAGPSVLVPRSSVVFPPWEAGPLHALLRSLRIDPNSLAYGLSAVVLGMTLAYAVLLAAARSLSLRLIVATILALHLILLLSPPLQLTDVFNYLGYARLGALHHLNPYTHVIGAEQHDPVFRFSTWHNLHSPYGPLFTAVSYLLPTGSLAVSYWLLKLITVLASLAFLGLVWHCARQLWRDPRVALLLVAANPIYLIWAIGGFHNDFFMLVPAIGAIALLLARRDRSAGAVLMLAVAVKFSAVLLLPFLLVAVPTGRRKLQLLIGAGLATLALAALSLVLFGPALPNLQDQSTLLTQFSIPNVTGFLLGIGGGTPGLLRAANVALVLVVALLLRRRGDWVSRAGWATLALLLSLAWLMPWYVIWLAPLAALGSSTRLRWATLALTVFLVATFIPATGLFLSEHGLSTMNTPAGQASAALQYRLAVGPHTLP